MVKADKVRLKKDCKFYSYGSGSHFGCCTHKNNLDHQTHANKNKLKRKRCEKKFCPLEKGNNQKGNIYKPLMRR